MAIDIVKYDGTTDVYAWKYPSQELGTWTQLIVNESQEAILYKSGKALDLFGPGRHTLSTNNVPLLRGIVNLPFGGKTPFTAEVWYVNKVHSLDVKWGTKTPIQLQDPKYQVFVPVRAFGQFGIQIVDTRKFLVKLVGTLHTFDKNTLVKYFRGLLLTKIKDHVATYLVEKKISILEISAYLNEISAFLGEALLPEFESYGIRVVNFFVTSINVPSDDPAVVKLKAALSKKAEMDIIGYNYQQDRTFNTLEKAASNEGGGSGLMGAGMGLSMGVGVGGMVGNMFKDQMSSNMANDGNQGNAGNANPSATPSQVTPAKNQEMKTFPCKQCGQECNDQMAFCFNCGTKIEKEEPKPEGKPCIKCGETIREGMTFCPYCGTKQSISCTSCGHELKEGMKFCPKCGTSV